MEVSGRKLGFKKKQVDQIEGNLCEVCEADNIKTTTNGVCCECKQFMCDTCFSHHLKAKTCRHHVLVDWQPTLFQENADNAEICKQHANEKIEFYCRKHETVGCGECMISVHDSCKPENIKDLSKQFHTNKDFKCIVGKLQDLMAANEENNKNVQENKKVNKDMIEDALEQNKTFRTEMNNYFDKFEASMTQKARNIEGHDDKLLGKLENDCKLITNKIKEVGQKLDTIKSSPGKDTVYSNCSL